MLLTDVPDCLEEEVNEEITFSHEEFVRNIRNRAGKNIKSWLIKKLKNLTNSKHNRIGSYFFKVTIPGFVEHVKANIDLASKLRVECLSIKPADDIEKIRDLAERVYDQQGELKKLREIAKTVDRERRMILYGPFRSGRITTRMYKYSTTKNFDSGCSLRSS